MYQSRPDHWLTGNLYISTSGTGLFPGITSPCRHYPTARSHEAYANLASPGHFQVLGKDPDAATAEQYIALLEVTW